MCATENIIIVLQSYKITYPKKSFVCFPEQHRKWMDRMNTWCVTLHSVSPIRPILLLTFDGISWRSFVCKDKRMRDKGVMMEEERKTKTGSESVCVCCLRLPKLLFELPGNLYVYLCVAMFLTLCLRHDCFPIDFAHVLKPCHYRMPTTTATIKQTKFKHFMLETLLFVIHT